MSAFVVVEMTVKDPEARARYAAAAAPTVMAYGGEYVARGAWTVLHGEPSRPDGVVVRFEDREQALAWYNSPDYQATLADRALGLDCRFQLLG